MNTQRWSPERVGERLIEPDDEALLREVRRVLASELLLGDCSVDPGMMPNLRGAAVLFPAGYSGDIYVTVEDGVVTLMGHVCNAAEKQLASRLAWRVPGCRDVVNAINAPLPPR